jgi:hypothetical protein
MQHNIYWTVDDNIFSNRLCGWCFQLEERVVADEEGLVLPSCWPGVRP